MVQTDTQTRILTEGSRSVIGTHKHTDTQTHRHSHRPTDTHTDTQTHRQTDRPTDSRNADGSVIIS